MSEERHFLVACAADEVREGGTKLVRLGDAATPVLLCRSGGAVHAIDPWCSHAFQELSCGTVRDGWIACPAHGARFDLASGEPINPPATSPIAAWPVRVRSGLIEVAL